MPAQRAHVLKHVRGAGTHWDVLNVHMGTCLSGHTGGGGVFIGKNKCFLTFVLHLNRPIFGLPNFAHVYHLNPRGSPKKPLDLIHFFVQSLNAPLLPVAMYSSYEARKNTYKTNCSATFAPFTPHHTPPHHQRHHTTKKHRHTRTRTCICTCICICMCTCRCTCMCICIYINILTKKT